MRSLSCRWTPSTADICKLRRRRQSSAVCLPPQNPFPNPHSFLSGGWIDDELCLDTRYEPQGRVQRDILIVSAHDDRERADPAFPFAYLRRNSTNDAFWSVTFTSPTETITSPTFDAGRFGDAAGHKRGNSDATVRSDIGADAEAGLEDTVASETKSGERQNAVPRVWLATVYVSELKSAKLLPPAARLTAPHQSSDVNPRPCLYAAV